MLLQLGVGPGAHGDRHFPPYPPDVLHQMGHVPEFLGPAAAHFHPPVMAMPPHVIPGPGITAVPRLQFGTPFHPVPMIPLHEPWVNNGMYGYIYPRVYCNSDCHLPAHATCHHSENIMKEWQLK